MKHNLLFLVSTMFSLYGAQSVILPHVAHAAALPRLATQLVVEVSAGELLDKLTILYIKSERITNLQKLTNIQTELTAIERTIRACIPTSAELDHLIMRLKLVNEELWDIEDAIRAKEARQEFDREFIEIARSVYFKNDIRGNIKREINQLLGSHLMEEKQYTQYEQN